MILTSDADRETLSSNICSPGDCAVPIIHSTFHQTHGPYKRTFTFCSPEGRVWLLGNHLHSDDSSEILEFSLVPLPDDTFVVSAETVDKYCEPFSTLCLTSTGQVYEWEISAKVLKLLEIPIRVISLSCGSGFHMLIGEDSSVYSIGENKSGQLGLGYKSPNVTGYQRVKLDTQAERVFCGVRSSFIISKDGSLWGCGANEYCQLGQKGGDQWFFSSFIQIYSSSRIASLAPLCYKTVILLKNGRLHTLHKPVGSYNSEFHVPGRVKLVSLDYFTTSRNSVCYCTDEDGNLWSLSSNQTKCLMINSGISQCGNVSDHLVGKKHNGELGYIEMSCDNVGFIFMPLDEDYQILHSPVRSKSAMNRA